MDTTSSDKPTLSIVIAAFNERHRLGATLEQLGEHAAAHGEVWEVIVVDDGSTDGTGDLGTGPDVGPLRLRVIANPTNCGKGFSVKRGVLEAAADRILMCDADMSMPVTEIPRLLRPLDEGLDIAIASRDMPESVLAPPQPRHRRLLGTLFRWARGRLLVPQIRDTQCGFKCFKAAAARHFFPRVKCDRFAFDCEVLALADKLGYRVAEVGVTWRDDRDSRVVPIRDGIAMLMSVVGIWWRLRYSS